MSLGIPQALPVALAKLHRPWYAGGTRVMCLTGWLLDTLTALRHDNGTPMVRIYGPRDVRMRGATIALNFLDPTGAHIESELVERQPTA